MAPDPTDTGYEDSAYPEGRGPTRRGQQSAFLQIVLALLKRPWLTAVSLFFIVVPFLFYLYTQAPLYRSQSVVSTSRPPIISTIGLVPFQPRLAMDSEVSEYFYVSILESNAFLEDVTQAMLGRRPEFSSAPDSLRTFLRKSISYTRRPRAVGFLVVAAVAESPELARDLAMQALASFEKIAIDLRRTETASVSEFIETQLVELNRSLADVEAQMQDFLRSRGLSLDQTSGGIDSELRGLEHSLAEAQTTRDLARLQTDSYAAQIKQRVSTYLSRNRQESESGRLEEIRVELDQLNRADQDSINQLDSAAFSSFQRYRQGLLKEILRATGAGGIYAEESGTNDQVSLRTLEDELEIRFLEYESAQIRFSYFKGAVEEFLRNHPDLPNDFLEYYNITRTKSVLQRTIDIMVDMRERTRIQVASETGGIKVIDHPNTPPYPISQRRGAKLAAAILMAVFIGAMTSYLVDRVDNTVQGESDIQNRFNLPVYGSVPVLDLRSHSSSRGRSSRRRSSSSHPRPDARSNGEINFKLLDQYSESSPISEAYRSIKTALLFTSRDRQKKTFVITSPVASDGKSLTAYNLGVSFAQGGLRTLVVDADLRRSSQHKLFGKERTPGLTDYLHGKTTLDEAIVSGPIVNFYLMPSGMRVSNPAELLSSHLMEAFFREAETRYDMILVDTPPITPCMDSRHLATIAGGMIVIVRAEATKLNVIEHSISLCSRVNAEILGVLVNHAAFRYGYGYYYLYQRYNPYGYYYSGYQYYYSQDPETGEKVRKKRRKSHTHSYDTAD